MTQHGGLSREEADMLLRRALDDTGLLATLRGAYRGRHDVLDALWWCAHPLSSSPAGATDPAEPLRPLQRAVYSRPDGDDALLRSHEAELHALQTSLADDARRLAEAVAAIGSREETDDGPATLHPASASPASSNPALATGPSSRMLAAAPSPAAAVTIATVPAQHASTDGTANPAAPRRPGRRVLVAASVTAAAIAALVFIPSIPSTDAGTSEETPPPRSDPRMQTEIVPLAATGNVTDPIEILARPTTATDELDHRFGTSFDEGSLRRLPDLVGHVTLYLGRSPGAQDVCLIVHREDGTGMAACTDEAQFGRVGVSLRGSERYSLGPDTTILTESFSLMPNGDFRYEATARAPTRQQPHVENDPA